MTDPLTATGGMCAPTTPPWGLTAGPDPKRLEEAIHATRSWINEGGIHFRVSINPNVLTPANTDEEARLLIADLITRRAIETYTRPATLAELLPTITAPRGGIRYPTPPNFGGWPAQPPPPTGIRHKAAELTGAVRRHRQRIQATSKRLADARAVWRGTKDALTEAEQEALTEY